MSRRITTRPAPMGRPPGGGRAVAWVGFVFGSVMSTAANVLYTWIPPEGAPADWSPTVAAQIGAAVWPIALLLSVEILSRVRWAAGWQWSLARYGGAGVVAVGSALISYGHLHGVLEAWSYGAVGSAMGPLVLDGLMVVSGFALLSPAEPDQRTDSVVRRDRTVADRAARTGVPAPGHVDSQPAPRTVEPPPRRSVPARTPAAAPVAPAADVEAVAWARAELADGRTAGWKRIRGEYPHLSERAARKAATEARNPGLRAVSNG